MFGAIDTVVVLLVSIGFGAPASGGPLRRTIQREIEDQLSEKIPFGEV